MNTSSLFPAFTSLWRAQHSFTLSLLLAFFLCTLKANAQYATFNMSLLSHWDDSTVVAEGSSYQIRYSSVWGWADTASGREYAIIGSTAGTYFIEVTNPTMPVVRDYVAGRRDSCIWREYKTYQHYAYMVSDDAAPNSFQIFDLQYLPDSVHVVYDSDSILIRSHTLYIDGNKLYCNSVKFLVESPKEIVVYSLANPELPLRISTINDYYPNIAGVHDNFVRNDTMYVSDGYNGYFVYKFNNADSSISMLGSTAPDVNNGYNHSSAITQNGKYAIYTDEVPTGFPVVIADVSDLTNITLVDTFRTNLGATPHNLEIIGNTRLVLAYYMDGVQIYDISDPHNPVRTGYFDTYPQNGTLYPDPPKYQGCWGVYTSLPSHVVLASDMTNGLFVIDGHIALGTGFDEVIPTNIQVNVWPNPFTTHISVGVETVKEGAINCKLADVTGRIISEKTTEFHGGKTEIYIPVPKNTSEGMYILTISTDQFKRTFKLVK